MGQRQFRSDDTSVWVERYGNGSDGAGSINTSTDNTTTTPKTTLSVASGATAATFGSGTGFANGDLVMLYQTRNGGTANGGYWELNKIASGGGTTSVTLAYATVQAYDTKAQVLKLKQYSSYVVNSAQTLTLHDWDQSIGGILPILCNGPVTITGSIVGSGKGFRGGLGGTDDNADSGEGSGAASANNVANPAGNGGGSSHVSSSGGGNASTMSGPESATGTADGNASLTQMVFGGGGGGTGESVSSGAGGNGGGVVLIIAPTITVTGSIAVNGNNGQNASRGGSGGAGGSVLLKGQRITLGSSLITASAGNQGTGTTANSTNGSAGRIHADYSISISGTTSPTINSTQDFVLNNLASMFELF